MRTSQKRKIRDIMRLAGSFLFVWLYIPHLLIYKMGGGKKLIDSDIDNMLRHETIKVPHWIALLYFLHNDRYYRTSFYYRIGPILAMLIRWYRPGDRYFNISYATKIGRGLSFAHPYATVINAETIGENFSLLHCTTIGAKGKGLPVIGDNVKLGANVTIIGPVHIGSNVTIGAGSVVVKDIPDSCIAVGNPARVIKFIE